MSDVDIMKRTPRQRQPTSEADKRLFGARTIIYCISSAIQFRSVK